MRPLTTDGTRIPLAVIRAVVIVGWVAGVWEIFVP